MKDTKPIPIPWSARWRQIRFQLLPAVVFLAASSAVYHLWREEVSTAFIHGQVDALFSEVTSPGNGSLAGVLVDRFSWVDEGDVLGSVIVTPSEILETSLAVLQAEIALARLGGLDPILDQRRNLLQLESLKHDFLAERTSLALLRVRLPQAEREMERVGRLFAAAMISEEEHDLARTRVELVRTEIENREILVREMEASLDLLRAREDSGEGMESALRATLAWHGQRLALLEAELKPVLLRAPISGLVTDVHRQNGEWVRAGEPVLTLRSARAEAVTAYVRQPLRVEPEVGMPVEIVARRSQTLRFPGVVSAVGLQMEELPPALRRPYFDGHESGLPLRIELPPKAGLHPGELVEILFR